LVKSAYKYKNGYGISNSPQLKTLKISRRWKRIIMKVRDQLKIWKDLDWDLHACINIVSIILVSFSMCTG
jgi:hypothetical protein